MDELQISGKRFISSRRIARDNNYTPDYIGQLIRGGKVVGQKVGRAWYVDAVSFDTFLGSEGTTAPLADQKSSDLPSSGGTPAGQTFAQQEAPAFEPVKKVEPVVIAQKKEETHYVPLHVVKTSAPAEVPAGLRYYSDERPSLPEILEIQIEKEEPWVAYPAEETKSMSNDVFAPHVARRIRPVHIAGLAVLGIAVFIFSAVVATSVSLNLRIDADNAAAAYYGLGW